MTTVVNGLHRMAEVRGYAATIERRIDWLRLRLGEKVAARPELDPGGTYEAAEIAALSHALDLMNAEWDNLARLRRNVQVIENRIGGSASGVDVCPLPVEWAGPES